MLASPFMALFANLTDLKTSLHVLDRLILMKSQSLVDLIKYVFTNSKKILLNIDDADEMH